MICTGGRDTGRVTKVEGHATDAESRRVGFGLRISLGMRRRILLLTLVGVIRRSCWLVPGVACFRPVLFGTLLFSDRGCCHTSFCDIFLQLHRFMIAVSRVAVNHDGIAKDNLGSAPDPMVWDQGGPRKVRKTDIRINAVLASLPGLG